MAIITVKCKCGKEIKVDIKTIDNLRSDNEKLETENESLRTELNNIKAKVAVMEFMKKNPNYDFGSKWVNDLFGGGK